MLTTILTLLFLVAMLGRGYYCHEDNNFKLIAVSGIIVFLSSFLPVGVSAAICFAMVMAIAIVDITEDDFDIEDRLLYQGAEKLFGKSLPKELDLPTGSFGGGFAELCLRLELRKPTVKRSASIQYGCRIVIILIWLIALIVSFARIITIFGWWSFLIIPTVTFVMLVAILFIYFKLYQ